MRHFLPAGWPLSQQKLAASPFNSPRKKSEIQTDPLSNRLGHLTPRGGSVTWLALASTVDAKAFEAETVPGGPQLKGPLSPFQAMPVRSLNLKLRLKRSAEGDGVRQSIWRTHSVVNEAIREIEGIILLCRGTAYAAGDDELVSNEDVHRDALAFAHGVQERNGKAGVGSDDQVLDALRRFYEALVPSIRLDKEGRPQTADANRQAAAFAGPMMDATSKGFQSVFGKVLDPLPDWVTAMQQSRPGWQSASVLWLQAPEAEGLLRARNSPPAWVRPLRAGQPWQEAFVEDQERKRGEIHGVPALVSLMKNGLGLLPLMRPPIAARFSNSRAGLTPWDRLAMRLALAHLTSWESWNHRAAADHRRVRERRDLQAKTVATFGNLALHLREYEIQRHDELKRQSLADNRRPYRIGVRATRAWDRVCESWDKSGVTKQNRLDILAKLQTRLRGQFGDPDLFRWLAEDGREALWRNSGLLPALARLNALDRLLERKKDRAIYTPPDAQAHPRWILHAAPGGGNLREYQLEIVDGCIALTLPLLGSMGDGLSERSERIPLAPSGQMETAHWNGEKGKERRLHFTSAHQQFSAQLGGGEILLRRRHVENRKLEVLEHGEIGPVWFKLVLDVDSQAPAGSLNRRGQLVTPAAVHHFKTALVNRSKHVETLGPGLRVLSVNLGVRTFAACSVFELVGSRPVQGMAFLADANRQLWARPALVSAAPPWRIARRGGAGLAPSGLRRTWIAPPGHPPAERTLEAISEGILRRASRSTGGIGGGRQRRTGPGP